MNARPRADDRMIDALLLHLHDERAPERRELRVSRVLQAIRGGAETGALRPRVGARLWAAAAAILVAAGVLLLVTRPTPALASVTDIVRALAGPGDRTFRLRVSAPESPPEDARDPWGTPGRPGLDGAFLHLRQGKQYVLVRTRPDGQKVVDGYDGSRSWRLRRGALVETAEGPGAGGLPLPPLMADVPFADLTGALGRIERDYIVERPETVPGEPGTTPLRHVRARRRSHDVRGPATIEIWADPATAMPRRIVFDHAKFQGSAQPRRLTFDLTSEKPLPGDWFTPAPHLKPGGSD
jgi:hypothetical protein